MGTFQFGFEDCINAILVSIQLGSPASGDDPKDGWRDRKPEEVSIQLGSPASGDLRSISHDYH